MEAKSRTLSRQPMTLPFELVNVGHEALGAFLQDQLDHIWWQGTNKLMGAGLKEYEKRGDAAALAAYSDMPREFLAADRHIVSRYGDARTQYHIVVDRFGTNRQMVHYAPEQRAALIIFRCEQRTNSRLYVEAICYYDEDRVLLNRLIQAAGEHWKGALRTVNAKDHELGPQRPGPAIKQHNERAAEVYRTRVHEGHDVAVQAAYEAWLNETGKEHSGNNWNNFKNALNRQVPELPSMRVPRDYRKR